MSRLIDDLNQVAKGAAPPMGFRASRAAAPGPRLRLVAVLSGAEDADRAALVDGADAVLLRPSRADLSARALQKLAGGLPGIPWGCWLEDLAAKKAEAALEAGADFLVFPPSSRVGDVSREDKAGRILEVDAALDDGLLRALNDLSAGAVLAGDAGGTTWQRLMQLQRLANLLAKPLLAAVPADVTAADLRAFWEAGVDGVVLEAAGPVGRFGELRRVVEGFPPRARKRGRAEAILPRLGAASGAPPEEEEEEEGDDD